MYKVIIIDDEPLARRDIINLLREQSAFEIAAECGNGQNAIKTIQEYQPDLIFLDIQMKDMDGFKVLEQIAPSQMPIVIFVTAYDQYAIRAFEYFAFDYLLKPFQDERFYQSLNRAVRHLEQKQIKTFQESLQSMLFHLNQLPKAEFPGNAHRFLSIKIGNKTELISQKEIVYLSASGPYVEVIAQQKKYILRDSLNHLESLLDTTAFCRIHRSYIINTHFLASYRTEGNEMWVEMKNSKSLRVSKSGRSKLQYFLTQPL